VKAIAFDIAFNTQRNRSIKNQYLYVQATEMGT